MKVPSEADLIELERFMQRWQPPATITDKDLETLDRCAAMNAHYEKHRVWATLKTLISLARDPSKLLQAIPDDDLIDQTLDRFGPPPRTSQHKLAPSAQPKAHKKAKK